MSCSELGLECIGVHGRLLPFVSLQVGPAKLAGMVGPDS